MRKRASVSAVLDQFFNTPVLSTNTSIVRGFLTRPSPGGRRSGLSAQRAPAGVAAQPQPPRPQPAHAVPLRPSLCAPGAGPAVRQALPSTARQPSDADAPDIQQLLRCHTPSPLLASPAASRRCAAPYEIDRDRRCAPLVCVHSALWLSATSLNTSRKRRPRDGSFNTSTVTVPGRSLHALSYQVAVDFVSALRLPVPHDGPGRAKAVTWAFG